MEIIPGFSMPLWSIITIITAAAALLIFIIIKIYLNYSLSKKCNAAANNPQAMKEFIRVWNGKKLLKKTRIIEKSAVKNGTDIITETGLDKLWEKQFLVYRRTRYLKKFINYFPEKGLFFCILGGKSRPAFEKIFIRAAEQSSDLNLLKKIAGAGDGNDFDGEYAAKLLSARFQDIIEMTGDSEWQVRFFAYKLLIHNSEDRAVRAAWEAFTDSAAQIRKTAATEIKSEDESRLSKALQELLLNDPVYSVRKAARLRIDKNFPELYRINIKNLSKPQILHLLGLLHDNSDEDINTATEFLLSEDIEIRLQAALYLQKQDFLTKLFLSADPGDKAAYDRTEKLLKMACEVNCTDFLRELEKTDNPASIHLAAGLLKDNGNSKYIDKLAERIFTDSFAEQAREHYTEIYTEALKCISKRGSDTALEMLNRELKSRHSEEDIYSIILPNLPLRGEAIFVPTLLEFLKTGSSVSPNLLRLTIERFPPSMYIEELVGLLRGTPDTVNANVKKEAFKILGELKMPCCLQMILENLRLLTAEEQKEFAVILKSYDEKAFTERVAGLLQSRDSAVKASILSSLPSTGLKTFIKDVKEASKDPDPEVRIASIWALAGYGEIKLISQMTDGLRDPVERVRRETAAVISRYGTETALNELGKLLKDPNEVYPVKTAAVYGLGRSDRPESTKILVDGLNDQELRQPASEALASKITKQEIRLLVELFKDAAPQLREYISEVFKLMGEDSEPAVTALLKEDISSLRETLSEVLLSTGYIETTVLKLRHRSPETRKQAAALLALMQTKEAFKGMVLAARDPDSEVRVEVLRALEKLNTPEGSQILNELKEDPDKRVRKYTLWALERIEAKNN
ncbi:MAG: HEAT repeat domain-containing protein [Spirochaetales bacterium]|uniref:HEAT repeat domain-containing protein n=1 Tax=Candidatus Thalassospirochaeta sargassi TaxID=3119039 RepID=A0AAJ1IEV5_9SPIO|nr:HEAT repeat domain-containing protein [Spirochaetales bacterium]